MEVSKKIRTRFESQGAIVSDRKTLSPRLEMTAMGEPRQEMTAGGAQRRQEWKARGRSWWIIIGWKICWSDQ
jgi:hypothetical protein